MGLHVGRALGMLVRLRPGRPNACSRMPDVLECRMKGCIDCVPCFVGQGLKAVRLATADPAVHETFVREVLAETARLDFGVPPPVMGGWMYRRIRKLTGNPDPYREHKQRHNALARRLYPEMQRRIGASDDPFGAAVRVVIAANIIDPGANSDVTEAQAAEALGAAVDMDLPGSEVAELADAVARARRILYVADNAGEIVFDRLLIERMPLDRITVVVRGHPIINDATMADAREAGLCDLVRVIDNGTDLPGTVLSECSPQVRDAFDAADVIIAKGQGNYETLNDADRNIFFLLMAKCPVVARDAGCTLGDIIARRRHARA